MDMAKINRVIVAVKQAMEENDINPQNGKRTTKATTKHLLCLFSTIEDVRMQRKIDYPLEYILLIAFLAILGNANTWAEIEDFGKSKERWLQKFLNVKKYGIPSHDTFRRVFGLIATSELQKIVVDLYGIVFTLMKLMMDTAFSALTEKKRMELAESIALQKARKSGTPRRCTFTTQQIRCV